MTAVTVRSSTLSWIEKKVQALQSRARKLGVTPPTLTVEEVLEEIREGVSQLRYRVTLEGEAPRITGWEFLATLDHKDDGNIIRSFPFSERAVPERFRAISPKCDHCRRVRDRRDTYLVINSEGVIQQVGSSCLHDFLGHTSPESILQFAEDIVELFESLDEFRSAFTATGERGDHLFIGIEYFLSNVHAAVRTGGWVSKTKALEVGDPGGATAARALQNLFSLKPDPILIEDRETAREALRWGRTRFQGATSEFEYNLRRVIDRDAIEERDTGFAAYLIPAYLKHREEASRPALQWVGTPGQKSSFSHLELLSVLPVEGTYGVSYLHKFSDSDGNSLIWFASSNQLTPGKMYQGVGTVKGHSEFRGQKQTVLTRARLSLES